MASIHDGCGVCETLRADLAIAHAEIGAARAALRTAACVLHDIIAGGKRAQSALDLILDRLGRAPAGRVEALVQPSERETLPELPTSEPEVISFCLGVRCSHRHHGGHVSADNLPTNLPPPVNEDRCQAFVDGVKALAEEHGVASAIVLFGVYQNGKFVVYAEAIGSERAHAELAAQAYAQHVLPVTQRADLLNRIAHTPTTKGPKS